MNVKNVAQEAWKVELVNMVHASLWREETIQHMLPEWCTHEKTTSQVNELDSNPLLATNEILPHFIFKQARETSCTGNGQLRL